MTVDPRLLKDIRRLVEDSLAYVHSNPFEIADYMYDLYLQHDRLDKLRFIADRLRSRLDG